MTLYRAAVVAWCVALAGCASPNLFVVDQEGKPIEGAEIYKVYPSFSEHYSTTDRNGAACIGEPSARPEFPYYVIKKAGYQTLELRDALPLRVTLLHGSP